MIEALEPGLVDAPVLPLSSDGRIVAAYAATNFDASPPTTADEALAALAREYDAPLPPSVDAAGADDPVTSSALEAWLRQVAEDVWAYAILVTDEAEDRFITHLAVYWRTPLASRIRIVRLPETGEEGVGRAEALDLLGTCAVEVEEWVSAPVDLAEDFLEREVSASMFVVAPDGRAPNGEWVPPERVVDALRFEDPATEDLDAFSAWFAGERPSAWAVTRLIPTLRSSLGPRDLFELFRTAR